MIKRWVKHFQAKMKVVLQIVETLWLLIEKKKPNTSLLSLASELPILFSNFPMA